MDKEFVDHEISRITKNLDDSLVATKMKEFKLEKNFHNYVASDIIESYDKLIAQRKECIEKYSQYYKLFLSNEDDIDILKNYKLMLEKQNKEIEYWKKEIKPIKEMKKAMNDYSDDEIEKELRDELEQRSGGIYGKQI